MRGQIEGTVRTELHRLVELEVAAVHLYDQLMYAIDLPGPFEELARFRKDHAAHVEDISQILSELGETGVDLSRIQPRYDAEATMGGTELAVRAALDLERVTNHAWSSLAAADLPDEMSLLLRLGEATEELHLHFLRRLVESEVWEYPERAPSIE